MDSSAPLTITHAEIFLVVRKCVNDGINPITAAKQISDLVAQSSLGYAFEMQKTWSEGITMARHWDILDERHGRLSNLFSELSNLRDSRCPWEEFESHCPCDDEIFRDTRAGTGAADSPAEREVLAICGFLARLVMAGVAARRLSYLALPCIDLLEPALDLFRGTPSARPQRRGSMISPERFQIVDFWIHACGKQIYAAGQAMIGSETGEEGEVFQFPQLPPNKTLPSPLRCQFRRTQADLVASWRAWECLFRAFARRAETMEPEEENMLLQAKALLEYMEMVESEYERAVQGDMGAMEAMMSFGGV